MGQQTNVSPFSRISIGDIQEPTFAQNFAMGGLSYGMQSPSNINPFNPASYSRIFWTSFEVAVASKNYWLTDGNQSEKASVTNFDHLVMGFPVTPWWGLAFGVMPVSNLGYDYKTSHNYTSQDTINITYNDAFTGKGGINRVFIGNGFSIKRKLFFGFNFSYYFGKLEYQEAINFTITDNLHNSATVQNLQTGDVYFDFGAQYRMNLTNKWRMDLGAIFVPLQGLNSKMDEFTFTFSQISGSPRIIDTVSFSENVPFSLVLPPKYGVGVVFNRGERFKIGMDIDYTLWSLSNYNTYGGLNDVYGIRTGGEYTGKDDKYILRLGLKYASLPIVLNGSKSDQMAATFGLAFPIRSKDKLSYTVMNFGVEFGKRGKVADNWLEEKYVNINVGLTLNNRWFIKRVYD